MVLCSVLMCHNRSDRKRKPGISFHRFPQDEEQKRLWVHAVMRQNWQPNPQSGICSDHFKPDDIHHINYSGPCLKRDAVPTIFSYYSTYLHQSLPKKRKMPCHLDIPSTSKKSPDLQESDNETQIICEVPPNQLVQRSPDSKDETNESFMISSSANTSSIKQEFRSYSFLMQDETNESDMLSSTNTNAISEDKIKIKSLEWKFKQRESLVNEKNNVIKTLRNRSYRQSKSMSSLKELLVRLKRKNLIYEDFIDNHCVGGVHKELLLRKISNVSSKYSPEIRAFALTLDLFSPNAYRYARKSFNSCSPHPRTLTKWYSSVNGEPGFSEECLKRLEILCQLWKCIWALVVDEMAIRKQIEWSGSNCSGFVNFEASDNETRDNRRLAKE